MVMAPSPGRSPKVAKNPFYGVTPTPRRHAGARGGGVAPIAKAAPVGKLQPVSGLDDGERALLGEPLRALHRQRGAAWNAACDAADGQGRRPPAPRAFGIEDIRRLARQLGVGATHWIEE